MPSNLAINGGRPVVADDAVKPWPTITQRHKDAVCAAMDASNPWKYPMPDVVALENEWAAYTGAKHCLAANSGTAALHMAIAAAEIGPGDEVIAPAFTFIASATCILHANAIPVFADIDPATATIDPADVERRITDRTRGIVAVDIHGIPADFDALRAVADKHGLVLIEDGSQAQGATYKGRKVGTLGHISGVSLNGSKNLPALCEGGLVTSEDPRYIEIATRVRMFGEAVDPGKPREYNSDIMGWNYRMSGMEAAFARVMLEQLDENNAGRIRNCEFLNDKVKELPGIEIFETPADREHVYFFWVIRCRPEEYGLDGVSVAAFRDALSQAMVAEGVPLKRWQTMTLPEQALFHYRAGYGKGCPWTCGHARPDISYDPADYPESRRLIAEFLALGNNRAGIMPPNDLELMSKYVDAFQKVLVDNRDEFVALVRRA